MITDETNRNVIKCTYKAHYTLGICNKFKKIVSMNNSIQLDEVILFNLVNPVKKY